LEFPDTRELGKSESRKGKSRSKRDQVFWKDEVAIEWANAGAGTARWSDTERR
jgi:hypothetical protein